MFERIACAISHAAGRPWAAIGACLLVIVWVAFGPVYEWSEGHSLFINTATTITTFLMTFVIISTQNRDGVAVQAKLDTIIDSLDRADNALIGAEKLAEKQIEELRKPPPSSVR